MSTVPVTPSTTAATARREAQRMSEATFIAKIGDVIRSSLLTNKLERMPLLLQSVTQQVTRQGGRLYIKNFWNDPKRLSLGYVGIHVRIRMPLPANKHKYILMEVQIHPKQIMDGTEDCAKEIAHRLYKMPGEAAEEEAHPDIISSSQLVYLTSMIKLLYTRDELKKVENILDLMQEATEAGPKERLVLETALLLNNKEGLGRGEWNKELRAIVPKNRDAVAAAWVETAMKINKMLNLPVVDKDESYSWTNTATSVDELYADAEQMAPHFEKMCEEAAGQPGCSVNFGPRDRYMIKDRKSLQDKINKDKKLLAASPPPRLESVAPLPGGLLPKDAYVKLLVHLLENAAVKGIPPLVSILESQFDEVMEHETLTPRQSKSYQLVQMLLVDQVVSQVVLKNLQKLHAPEGLEQKRPPETAAIRSVSPERKIPPSLASLQIVPAIPGIAFGAAAWNTYFGDVGAEPPLPPNIEQILSSPCPFFPGKAVRETQLLVLMPKTVNGKPFTLNNLGELVKRPKQGPATQYHEYSWDEITKQYGDAPIPASYWVLFTKDVIPGSRNKSYDAQKQLIADYSRKTGMLYEMPTLLEAAAAIFIAHVQTGARLYSNEPWTYTRCQERVATHPDRPLVVGGFGPGGLDVIYDDYDGGHNGVGGSRKFS